LYAKISFLLQRHDVNFTQNTIYFYQKLIRLFAATPQSSSYFSTAFLGLPLVAPKSKEKLAFIPEGFSLLSGLKICAKNHFKTNQLAKPKDNLFIC
jgi:hypothetical protein